MDKIIHLCALCAEIFEETPTVQLDDDSFNKVLGQLEKAGIDYEDETRFIFNGVLFTKS